MSSLSLYNYNNIILNIKQKIQNILDKKTIIEQNNHDNNQNDLLLLDKEQTLLLEELQQTLYLANTQTRLQKKQETTDSEINKNNPHHPGNIEISTEINDENLLNDCKELPGFIFLHDNIIKTYGQCPYINPNPYTSKPSHNSFDNKNNHNHNNNTNNKDSNANDNDSNHRETLKKKREMWLQSRFDNGKTYYNLYDILINEKDITHYTNQKNSLENEIENIINITLNTNQKQLYNDALILLYEYNTSKLKSKKIKDKYKHIIFLFSKLFNETHIHLHEYISQKFDTQILINYNENHSTIYNDFLTKNFKEYVEKYVIIKQHLTNAHKYVKNTKKHLTQSFLTFLQTKENNIFIQEGKYFKKWSLLTIDEQNERFDSFAHYYISKKKNFDETRSEYTQKLSTFLKDSFKNKQLKYNLIKWNIKTGIIDSVLLEYIQEEDLFKLKLKPVTLKKSFEPISIFSKENEQNINEHILNFLIKNKKETDILETKYQELCFDQIKLDLNFKKISKNDKILLKKKYTDIYDIILKNKI